jgi:hypothetical protein
LSEPGKAHEWFNNYVVPYHPVFGRVGAIVQAQLTGAGGAERNWASLEHIWNDYRAHLSPQKAEKIVVIHEGHRREMQQLETTPSDAPLWKIWSKEEVDYDLGLDKYGAAVDMTAAPTTQFKCYIEDWEDEAKKNKSAENEFKLLHKYMGKRFFDDDDDKVYVILDTNLEWKKKDKHDRETPCYCVLAKPADEESDEDEEADGPVCYHINEALIDMIRSDKSGHPPTLELVFP